MSLPVIFLPEARSEFDDAYDWYERQQTGLGEAFADRVQEVLDRIEANAGVYAKVLGEVRKAVVTRFPFCVYYREEASCVRVLSMFQTSRDPSVRRGRA